MPCFSHSYLRSTIASMRRDITDNRQWRISTHSGHWSLRSAFDPKLPLALHPLRRIDDRKIFELNAERQWISAWLFGEEAK
jgi:hypothetical protein